MKIARITNDGKLLIKGEVIEEGVDFFTPKDILGCQLWLDATTIQANNGDNILLWEDLSGNNNHATQTNQSQQPIFIDNAVVFDGVDDSLEFGENKFNMGLDDMTFFSVITTTKTTDQSIFSKARASVQDYRYALRMTRGGVMHGFMQGNGGNDVTPFGVTNLANGNPHVLVYEFNRSGNLSLYADGIYEGGASISHWENANMVSINPSRLGAYTASNNISPTRMFEGKIMEILIYDRVLSKEEREEVKLYLEAKWIKDKMLQLMPNGDLIVYGKLVKEVVPLPPEDEIWIYGTFTTTYEIGQLLGDWGSNVIVVDFYYDDDHYVIKASGTNLGEGFCQVFNTNGNTVIFGSRFSLGRAFQFAPKSYIYYIKQYYCYSDTRSLYAS